MASLWQVHTNQEDGRLYYFNTASQTSTWEKPDVLKSPLEVRDQSHLEREHWKQRIGRNIHFLILRKSITSILVMSCALI